MRIGGSLFLLAAGAILRFAVTFNTDAVDLRVVGVILMIIGGIGLLLEVGLWVSRRHTVVVHRSDNRYPPEPRDQYERY